MLVVENCKYMENICPIGHVVRHIGSGCKSIVSDGLRKMS